MSFQRYEEDDSTISLEEIIKPCWNNTTDTLTTFYTSSEYNKDYYLDVFDTDINSIPSASVAFSIQYGHVLGSASTPINSGVDVNTPTRTTYGQYRNIIYGDENTNFNFGANSSSLDVIVISIARERYKEGLQPGSFNLTLTSASNSLYLTDNSKTVTQTNFIGSNRYYTIVSGSNGVESENAITNPSGSYGFVFPDLAIAVLNPKALTQSTGDGGMGITLKTDSDITASDPNPNTTLVYDLIKDGASFKLNSKETIASRYFYTRIKHNLFNYTTNPSIIDSNGNILYSSLIDNPQTYITTVGLYNDQGELLSVAKLSKPIVKNFTKDLNLTIKLNY